jgi:hypothetical protein
MLAVMDMEEIAYQMALDVVEAGEVTARRAGVPTLSETLATPPGRRIGRHDPDWFAKLDRMTAR